VAAIRPSQTIDRPSSTARYDVVTRTMATTTCTSAVLIKSGTSRRKSVSLERTRAASFSNIGA
jgi:hypothetical protein